MYSLEGKFYSPSLREKSGELRALRALDSFCKDSTLPILVALPLSEKENRNLTLDGLVRREVGRVQKSWNQRVCLWDPRFLVFDDGNATEDGKWLEKLLQQFSAYGGKIIPVVGLRDAIHRTSAISAHARNSKSGIAIRIDYDDIEEFDLLNSVMKNSDVKPDDCILVVDLSGADISEHEEFAKSLIAWLYEFRERGNWAKIIVTGSSFPIKNPAPAMGNAISPRLEWRLWKWALDIDRSISAFAIFGDFGADNSRFRFEGGGRPIPHLRYAREPDWFTSRGDTTYASIRGVSRRIVDSENFRGRDFSFGDEFIYDCSAGLVKTADPTAWRAVNMNHHMTEAVVNLAEFYGTVIPARRKASPQQVSLFDMAADPAIVD